MIELQTMDVIVVDGKWYNPLHWLIRWRGLDSAVHVLTVMTIDGKCWSPDLSGINIVNLDEFKGRRITIHRFTGSLKNVYDTAVNQYKISKGYDLRQWLIGFVFGISIKKWADSSNQFTCAEFPYWAFQDNMRITPEDEVLPMPRLFRYNSFFVKIYDGVLS